MEHQTASQIDSTFHVAGYVYTSDGAPLANAYIKMVNGKTKITHSLEDGSYRFDNFKPGEYQLICSYAGYETAYYTFTLDSDFNYSFILKEKILEFDEVVVLGESYNYQNNSVNRLSVQQVDFNYIPDVFERDAFRMLQLLPGIKSSSDFSANLYIRGFGPEHSKISLDGANLFNPYHFFGFYSTFNPDVIERIELFKSTAPASQSGRVGSYLNIQTKDNYDQKWHGGLTVGTLASRIYTEIPIGRRSNLSLAARRSTLDPILKELRKRGENLPVFHFIDLNAKWHTQWDNGNSLSLFTYTGMDKADFPYSSEAQLLFDYTNHASGIEYNHFFSSKLIWNTSASFSSYINKPQVTAVGSRLDRRNEIENYTAKSSLEIQLSKKSFIKLGLEAEEINLRLRDTFSEQNSSVIDEKLNSYKAFIGNQTELWSWLRFTGGVNYRYLEQLDKHVYEPRAGLSFVLHPRLQVQASYGHYQQFIYLISNQAFSGMNVWVLGNEDTPSIRSRQYSAGIKWNPKRGHNLSVSAFYNDVYSLTEFDPFSLSSLGLIFEKSFINGSSYAKGLEFIYKKSSGHWTGHIAYNYSLVRKRLEKINNFKYYPPRFDSLYELNWVNKFNLGKNWNVSAVFNYTSGQAYTSPTSRTTSSTFQLNIVMPGLVNANRLPPYHRLDLGVTKEFLLTKHSDNPTAKGSLTLQLINVYNRQNTWFTQVNIESDKAYLTKYYQLPLLPNISLSLSF